MGLAIILWLKQKEICVIQERKSTCVAFEILEPYFASYSRLLNCPVAFFLSCNNCDKNLYCLGVIHAWNLTVNRLLCKIKKLLRNNWKKLIFFNGRFYFSFVCSSLLHFYNSKYKKHWKIKSESVSHKRSLRWKVEIHVSYLRCFLLVGTYHTGFLLKGVVGGRSYPKNDFCPPKWRLPLLNFQKR